MKTFEPIPIEENQPVERPFGSEDIIRIHNQFYVLANSSLNASQKRVLKQLDSFQVCETSGDITPMGDGSCGFYLGATRHLSVFEFRISRRRPLVLKSEINSDNLLLSIDAMNPDFKDDAGLFLARGTIHFLRSRFLWKSSLSERIRITNFGKEPAHFSVELSFAADFKDMFEIRGVPRKQRGVTQSLTPTENCVRFAYTGLDEVVRSTDLYFSIKHGKIHNQTAHFPLVLAPGERQTLYLEAVTDADSLKAQEKAEPRRRFLTGYRQLRRASQNLQRYESRIESSDQHFNSWIERSRSDLHLMLTPTPQGFYPYAGIPWFNTVFGRDGILTALQSLWMNPEIARGVLAYLAVNQAVTEEPHFDAQPGKILHEVRTGEMVALREVPFEKYYGSIDSTPLFVILAGAYLERTNDTAFITSIWPNIRAALQWIDQYGDMDGDGFVEYEKRSPNGLQNQGWKDSHDCISYADGSLAKSPIALAEVQGYVYEAKRKAADMARVMGENTFSFQLQEQAVTLKRQFEEKFWWEEAGTYYIALDGDKRPCDILSSNPGHCLFTGIVSEDRAARLAKTLMGDRLFTGWGIRTLAQREARYNPMSYHNGSVWPHDTAIACEGLARFGFKEEALLLMQAVFDSSLAVDLQRLPELFCGFSRRAKEGPTLYPVACSPQAWAAGSAFLLLKACLGLTIRARENKVQFHRPVLPSSIKTLELRNLRVGESVLDIMLSRQENEVGINILKQSGPVEVSLSRLGKFSH